LGKPATANSNRRQRDGAAREQHHPKHVEHHVQRIAEGVLLVAQCLELVEVFRRLEVVEGRDGGGEPGDLAVEREADPLSLVDACRVADQHQHRDEPDQAAEARHRDHHPARVGGDRPGDELGHEQRLQCL
jgi:hypothetical protein